MSAICRQQCAAHWLAACHQEWRTTLVQGFTAGQLQDCFLSFDHCREGVEFRSWSAWQPESFAGGDSICYLSRKSNHLFQISTVWIFELVLNFQNEKSLLNVIPFGRTKDLIDCVPPIYLWACQTFVNTLLHIAAKKVFGCCLNSHPGCCEVFLLTVLSKMPVIIRTPTGPKAITHH